MENVQVLIIGGGIAGICAAIWCERLNLQCILLEREATLGGQLWQIRNEIWDFPPSTYENGQMLLNELRKHRTLGQLDLRMEEQVLSVDPSTHTVRTNKNEYLPKYVIIATGVSTKTLPIIADSKRVLSPGFSTTEKSELLREKEVLVIGGGDRAVESSCNIATYAKQVSLIVRDTKFRARAEWVQRLHLLKNVRIFLGTQIVGCFDESDRAVVTLLGNQLEVFDIHADWMLPRVGVKGNSEAFSSLQSYGDGFLSVDAFQKTNEGWVYAIGDITNSATYASLSLASGQAMKAVKHISMQLLSPNISKEN